MNIDFKTAVFINNAANTQYQILRARLIVKLHDLRGQREVFKESKGEEAEEAYTASIEIAEGELRELEEAYGATKKALRERWGEVFE